MLSDREDVARLLFSDQMVDPQSGTLTDAAFPTNELAEVIDKKTGAKKSVSVDRCDLLSDVFHVLSAKGDVLQRPDRHRSKYGYACVTAAEIRSIVFAADDGTRSVFNTFEDPIQNGNHPLWDEAHAKLVRASPELTKGFLRGYRDKLSDLFQRRMVRF